jgi:glycosyltransferase involved in cell wall biosynthesis
MTEPLRPNLSVVMPAYQLGPVIEANIRRVVAVLAGMNAYEVVVVDDGSTDDTYAAAVRAAASLPEVVVERHPRNRGKGQALFTGARRSRGDLICFLDADLDLPPEQLPRLIAAIGNADVLVGAKRQSMGEGRYPLLRRVLSRIFAMSTVGLFGLPVTETQTGLKLLRRPVLDFVIPAMRIRGYAYDLEMLVRAHRAGFKIVEAPVDLGLGASTAPLRLGMMWQMARDTARLWWWILTGRVPRRR